MVLAKNSCHAAFIPFDEANIRKFEEIGAWRAETLWGQFERRAEFSLDWLAGKKTSSYAAA